jgi:RNA polymerase sigma-70 factor (ECF subfamily)
VNTPHNLLARARQWDEAALAEVYDTYAPALYRYAYRLTGHAQTSQDIVSETFRRFLLALRRGAGPADQLSAWLYRVAHNLVVDSYRQQSPTDLLPLDEDIVAVTLEGGPSHVAHQEEVARARAALQQLTPLQQQVLVLRFLEELSNAEVAEIVGRTEGAVKGIQHRTLQALRRILEE